VHLHVPHFDCNSESGGLARLSKFAAALALSALPNMILPECPTLIANQSKHHRYVLFRAGNFGKTAQSAQVEQATQRAWDREMEKAPSC